MLSDYQNLLDMLDRAKESYTKDEIHKRDFDKYPTLSAIITVGTDKWLFGNDGKLLQIIPFRVGLWSNEV